MIVNYYILKGKRIIVADIKAREFNVNNKNSWIERL